MADVPICFIDTETTSLDPRTREPWEIAIIRREPDGTEKRWQSFVSVTHLELADPMSLKIGRFYERHPLGRSIARLAPEMYLDVLDLNGQPTPQSRLRAVRTADPIEAALEVAQWTHGAHVVGAVPSFDADTLQRLLWAEGFPVGWHYHLIDVESYAAGRLGLEPPYSHEAILATFGLVFDESKRHTAMGDAEMDMALYDAVRTAQSGRIGFMPGVPLT